MEAGMLEKGILGTIWSFCFGFGFFGETCEIRENPFSKSGMIMLFCAENCEKESIF
jgi:hypothetical protein